MFGKSVKEMTAEELLGAISHIANLMGNKDLESAANIMLGKVIRDQSADSISRIEIRRNDESTQDTAN